MRNTKTFLSSFSFLKLSCFSPTKWGQTKIVRKKEQIGERKKKNRSWWEKHFAFNFDFDLKNVPCSKKQILFWKTILQFERKVYITSLPSRTCFFFIELIALSLLKDKKENRNFNQMFNQTEVFNKVF